MVFADYGICSSFRIELVDIEIWNIFIDQILEFFDIQLMEDYKFLLMLWLLFSYSWINSS